MRVGESRDLAFDKPSLLELLVKNQRRPRIRNKNINQRRPRVGKISTANAASYFAGTLSRALITPVVKSSIDRGQKSKQWGKTADKRSNLKIPQAEDAKYLGLHLDRRLNWRKHIFTK